LNPTWEKEAAYSYYAHGPLARTVIGEQEVQGLDYVYTLQGWIKGVNSNNLDANNDPGKDGLGLSANHRVAQDVMGYSLHYFNNDYLPIVNGNTTFIADQSNSDMLQNSSDLYNGNIARMVTTITDPNSRAVLPLGNAYGYDQLNRLQKAVSFDQLNGNAWAGGAPAKYQNSFTYDANGNILTQTRNDDNNQVIDELAYFYPKNAANKTVRNRLLYVSDNVDYDASDIDPGMATSNYAYDEEGRLIQDLQEGIDEINWRVDGKVKSIKQSDNKQGEFSLSFDYDAMGHRIAKHSYDKDQAYNNGLGQLVKSTYYVLDAQGNTMATYERSIDNGQTSLTFAQTEKFIYGSARLGVQNVNIGLLGSQNNTYTQTTVPHRIGKKGYELSNHLGNVLSVISDKAIPHNNGGGVVDYFLADIRQAQDYSPFGVLLQNRNLSLSGAIPYRYGFNSMEKDDELKGEGNSYDFGARMYDPRIGRWFKPDRVLRADQSSYSICNNDVINKIDFDGNDFIHFYYYIQDNLDGNGQAFKSIHFAYEIVKDDSPNIGFSIEHMWFEGTYTVLYPFKPDSYLPDNSSSEASKAGMPLSSGTFFFGLFDNFVDDYTYLGLLLKANPGVSQHYAGTQKETVLNGAIANADSYDFSKDVGTGYEIFIGIVDGYYIARGLSVLTLEAVTVFATRSIDDILKSATPYKKIKPNAPEHYYSKSGNYDDALKDFNSMGLEDVKPLEGKHKGFMGTAKDGTTVTVRDGSRGRVSKKSEVTLQYNPTSGPKTKIRYGN